MRIFSICCVRDENDIIGETLDNALSWSDKIFVFDNGSTDGTWETIQQLSRKNRQIVLVGRDDRQFADELRGEIFECYRSVATSGDWWCRLDGDEIYIDDPRSFLADLPGRFGFVFSATCNYYFTDVDLDAYEKSPQQWLDRPVSKRLKFYQNNWSEPRFVRHRSDLIWNGLIWPDNRGLTSPSRIRLKHFPYRSPSQIMRRLAIRQTQPTIFKHEANKSLTVPTAARKDWSAQYFKDVSRETASWQDRVRKAADCDEETGDGAFVIRDELMPQLPSPAIDLLKVGLQRTPLGRSIAAPILKWRRSR
jgi:hypothetical protein